MMVLSAHTACVGRQVPEHAAGAGQHSLHAPISLFADDGLAECRAELLHKLRLHRQMRYQLPQAHHRARRDLALLIASCGGQHMPEGLQAMKKS